MAAITAESACAQSFQLGTALFEDTIVAAIIVARLAKVANSQALFIINHGRNWTISLHAPKVSLPENIGRPDLETARASLRIPILVIAFRTCRCSRLRQMRVSPMEPLKWIHANQFINASYKVAEAENAYHERND